MRELYTSDTWTKLPLPVVGWACCTRWVVHSGGQRACRRPMSEGRERYSGASSRTGWRGRPYTREYESFSGILAKLKLSLYQNRYPPVDRQLSFYSATPAPSGYIDSASRNSPKAYVSSFHGQRTRARKRQRDNYLRAHAPQPHPMANDISFKGLSHPGWTSKPLFLVP